MVREARRPNTLNDMPVSARRHLFLCEVDADDFLDDAEVGAADALAIDLCRAYLFAVGIGLIEIDPLGESARDKDLEVVVDRGRPFGSIQLRIRYVFPSRFRSRKISGPETLIKPVCGSCLTEMFLETCSFCAAGTMGMP